MSGKKFYIGISGVCTLIKCFFLIVAFLFIGFIIIVVIQMNVIAAMPKNTSTEMNYGPNKSPFLKQLTKTCFTMECRKDGLWISEKMNRNVSPCDDFYQFVCGNFLSQATIPNDKDFIGTLSIIKDEIQEQIKSILEEKSLPDDPRPFKLLKTFYVSCMNERKELKQLSQILKDLGDWPILSNDSWIEKDFDWTQLIYKLRKTGHSIDYFIRFDVDVDFDNNNKHVIFINQALLSHPRDYFFNDEFVNKYYEFMIFAAKALGADDSVVAEQLKKVLQFEINLAKISVPDKKLMDITLYSKMTIANLTKTFPSIPWLEYFNKLLEPGTRVTNDELVIVKAPSFIGELEKLLQITPKRVQANYAMWRFVLESFYYLDEYNYNSNDRRQRWEKCVDLVSSQFSLGVNALYVKKFFNQNIRNKAITLLSEIKLTFKKILRKIDWMDNDTKSIAIKKLKFLKTYLEYSDDLYDYVELEEFYEKLIIDPKNYLGSVLNLTIFNLEKSLDKLRQPVESTTQKNFGDMNPYYLNVENRIHFSVTMLQSLLLRNNRSEYVNYGAIGSIMGHELMHVIFGQGRKFDHNGRRDWWTIKSKKNFKPLENCLIQQYNNYTVTELDVKINGFNTFNENLADNGGLKIAYLAYDEWDKLYGPEFGLPFFQAYTPRQIFWISSASVWCQKQNRNYWKDYDLHNIYSPYAFRVIGSISNMPEFSNDFGCNSGSGMNPEKKCEFF